MFHPGIPGPTWPGPLADREAVFGEAWVGQHGMLDILETRLGLGGRYEGDLIRAASLQSALQETEGFWSRSLEADALGVAMTLVRWRDTLWMNGWRGEAVAPRLKELALATQSVLPGLPDRLAAVCAALVGRSVDVERVTLVEPREELPHAWRQVLEALEQGGTKIEVSPPANAPAGGDLAAARGAGFKPAGDGSLQLVRGPAPLQAADELAGWLAAQGSLEQVVVVGPDAVLDAAVSSHGLPTTGATASHQNVLSQLLSLWLAPGWAPPDPQLVMELLALPEKPVPPFLARRLADALQEWPAVGSDKWNKKLSEGLEVVEDDKRRAKIEERITTLLTPAVEGGAYSVAKLEQRVKVLRGWMAAKRETSDGDGGPWNQALCQCELLLRLVALCGEDALAAPALMRAVSDASSTADFGEPHQAQAGLAAVPGPACVLGPARVVIWWGFSRASAPVVNPLPLSSAEVAGLAGAGVALPDPGQQARTQALRWRRPLLMASERLLLACPLRDEADAEQFPHPLWDEVTGGLADGASTAPLCGRVPKAGARVKLVKRSALQLPAPRRHWKAKKASVPRREKESPSSIRGLLGCSFQWLLRYGPHIRGSSAGALSSDNLLWGSLAHRILEMVFGQGLPSTPDEARDLAGETFDDQVPRLASCLTLPGGEATRARVRQVVVQSAGALARQMLDAGLDVSGVEVYCEQDTATGRLGGQADMVAGSPPVVIDLKWGGATYRVKDLEAGTAFQLACYARLLREDGRAPMASMAYFILTGQRMLTTAGAPFTEAEVISGPSADVTWRAMSKAWKTADKTVHRGKLETPGVPDASGQCGPEKDAIVNGVLKLAPPCGFCEYGTLCGVALGEVRP